MLVSVITESKGLEGLPMATGLIRRFACKIFIFKFIVCCFTQVQEGQEGPPTAAVHRQRLLLCHWAI